MENQKDKISYFFNKYIINICMALIISFVILSMVGGAYHDPSDNGCRNLVGNYFELNLYECTTYLNDNPDATGQDVLDHYEIKNHFDMLNNPLRP